MRSIFLTLPLLILTFSATGYAQAETDSTGIPFLISSRGDACAMQGTFEGEYRLHPDRIEVTVTKATIYISPACPYQGRREIASLRLSLATELEGSRWGIRWRSERALLGRIMSPGEEYALEGLHFAIPRDEAMDLIRHWLIFVIEGSVLDAGEEQRRPGYCAAHSCRDIFSRRQD